MPFRFLERQGKYDKVALIHPRRTYKKLTDKAFLLRVRNKTAPRYPFFLHYNNEIGQCFRWCKNRLALQKRGLEISQAMSWFPKSHRRPWRVDSNVLIIIINKLIYSGAESLQESHAFNLFLGFPHPICFDLSLKTPRSCSSIHSSKFRVPGSTSQVQD